MSTDCNINVPELISKFFINDRLRSASNEKIAIVLVGGPGSGKSNGKSEAVKDIGKSLENFANIDIDEILTNLFKSNNNCYEKARSINKDSFLEAIKKEKNIIFDGTGRIFDRYSNNVIKKLKDHGYTVHLVIVISNVNKALSRIKTKREEG